MLRWARVCPVLLALCACTEVEEVLPPNVVLVVLDTVRADHTSAYGYDRKTTPHLDQLALEGVRYSECRATGPWTLPSHASMFTGRFPFQHRADSLLSDDGEWRELPLKSDHTTLAESLSEMGYRTAGFVANTAYLREVYQLNQGFDEYVVKNEPGVIKNEKAIEFVDGGTGPFFLFLNYMDAHRPYNTARLSDERMTQLECDGDVPSDELLDRMYDIVLRDGQEAPRELVDSVTRCYDLGIANGDLGVGHLIDELRKRNLLDNTLLIVTSDHGEFLGEHGLVEHSKDIYEEVLHVPLVCKFPSDHEPAPEPGSVDDRVISLADIPSLVASVMPDELAREMHVHFPLPYERDFTIAEITVSRKKDLQSSYGARFLRQRQVYYAGGHKLIRSSDGENELYDLVQDPGEHNNLYSTNAQLSNEMSERLEQYILNHPPEYRPAGAPEVNEEALRELRKLGYAGGDDAKED